MLEQDSALEDVLRMTPENILDRRLQTQVYLQGLSSTVKQARQLIVHGHISVNGAVTRVPGMTVTKLQEKNISYSPDSGLNSDLHPVRPGAKDTYSDDSNDEETEEKAVEESEIIKEADTNEEKSVVSETKGSNVEEKTTKKSGDKK
jgi:small subunit ribosomal protein S4